MGRYSGKPLKLLKCPDCKRYGLQTKRDKKGNFKVKCKLCNSFWVDEKALKIKELIQRRKSEIIIESNIRQRGTKRQSGLVKYGFRIILD